MERQMIDDNLIKRTLNSAKTIAMVGASTVKEGEVVAKARLKPSIIVMKYLLEFGYKVIPVNPISKGKKVHGKTIVEKLEDISTPIDIVNVFRPAKETPSIANLKKRQRYLNKQLRLEQKFFGYSLVFKIQKQRKFLIQQGLLVL